MKAKPFVFDASPLIYLSKADMLKHLKALRRPLLTTQTVFEEVVEAGKKRGYADALKLEEFIKKGAFTVVKVTTINPALLKHPHLHKGDREVLSYAKLNNCTAVMDEEAGRKAAEIEEIDCAGSIYVLFRLLRVKAVSKQQLRTVIELMINQGWRCSTELYAEILASLERE